MTLREKISTIGQAYKTQFARLKTWPFLRNLIVYFCVFSVVGHLIEWPYCAIGATFFNSVSWTDEVLANPLKPFMVYGFGIVICALLLAPIKDGLMKIHAKTWQALLVFFIMSVFLGMAMELIQGFLQNQPDEFGNYPLWDVHDYPGNILGQAWIVNDIMLGAVFSFATWHIYPMSEKRLLELDAISPKEADRNMIFIAVVFFIITFVTYVMIPMPAR